MGKTTLFNKLCGLRQKTGNYPGVTVDKKKGSLTVSNEEIELIDLPGINSLFPKSKDEELVVDYLLNQQANDFPEKLVVIVSALNFKRSMYLFDQIRDLNIPLILAINMSDLAAKRGIEIDADGLSQELGCPVVKIAAKKSLGLDSLKALMLEDTVVNSRPQHYLEEKNVAVFSTEGKSDYHSFIQCANGSVEKEGVNLRMLKKNEAILRYKYIQQLEDRFVKIDKSAAVDFTTRADKVLVHPVFGYLIFLAVLLVIFQAIFWLAAFPMDWIDSGFAMLSEWTSEILPEGYFSSLITEGVIPGIGGVVIFIPQIAILFFFFSILEESGYMQRIVHLLDRFMQKFGMSGKSIVPMITGFACAIPAIMSARTIENNKERLITILTTPLLTCSARIPVYVVIIAVVIPDEAKWGIFNAQGLALLGMYLLGVLMTLIVALVLKYILKSKYKSHLVIDMPEYLMPDFKNVALSVWTNAKSFVVNAGKIILAASIVLFVLATNGGETFENTQKEVQSEYAHLSEQEQDQLIASLEIERSYLGVLGQAIEPAIKPLGYDWKIGIALISSLAAREVFVGTLSTIYTIGSEDEMTIRDRLKTEKDVNGKTVFTFATSISLLLFYAFALQCFSTIAVTYKETKSLKWTSIQFVYMTALAYFSALIAYQILA